jgi:hypothetical protein
MKGKRIITLAIMAMLMIAAGAYTSAFAGEDESVFSVVNRSDQDVQVEVYNREDIEYGVNDENDDGVVRIYIVPANGSNDILLDNDDTFYYKYQACGRLFDGELDMEEDIQLVIPACRKALTKLQVSNHLGETITLTMVRDGDDETFEIEPGFAIIDVFEGENIFSYDACDTDFSGVVFVKANGRTKFYMRSCEWYDSPARIYGGLNPVNFTLINHASFPMIVTLLGQENYLITVQPGENRVRLIAGSYEYMYYMDYAEISGVFFVPGTGNGKMIFSPSYTIDNGIVEDEFE